MRPLVRVLLTASLLLGLLAGALFYRGEDPGTTGAWPRPFDPAKPFNMLGVPGVSVEQRKRAEDLLVRSLEAAPLWGDYRDALSTGGYTLADGRKDGEYEHVTFYARLNDEHFLDPRYPESLVYQLRDGERIFVAYMFMTDAGVSPDDPVLTEFAGPLLEWHVHDNVCLLPHEANVAGVFAGLKSPDGSCAVEGATDRTLDPRGATGELPAGSTIPFSSFSMIHVWVTKNSCGPFAALDGPARGTAAVPESERVDICRQ